VVTGVFGLDYLGRLDLGVALGYVASFTIVVSSLIALSQDGLKRRLAFSTIGQLSYIVLGVALLAPTGVLGGVLHIVMHAFGKITLFMCAGAIMVATGKSKISELDGIGRRMPVTMAAFFLGSLSVIGLPPAGGFLSKWLLLLGTLEAHQTVFLVVLLASSFLNAAYYLPIVFRAFFRAAPEGPAPAVAEAPGWCVAPLAATALVSVGLFFYPQPFLALCRLAVAGITGG
jgi:multicomponent Na+:H+ antiporter subunit D